MDKDEALNIAGDFQNYLRKSDKSFIEKYTKEEIKCALSLISHSDSNKQWYKEMERHIVELDASAKENKWHKGYFWDKIFPILVAGVISFAVGYSLKVLEVRNLKQEVQAFKTRESTIQSEIKKAVVSGTPSDLLDMLNKLNHYTPILYGDKRQKRILEDKADDLLEKLRLAVAKNDTVSTGVISRELEKIREKIRRLKE